MDEETNKLDTTPAAVITAVISYNNPQTLVPPEDFATNVLETIENGVMLIQSTSYSCQHPTCSCTDVSTCSECMLLSILSALETVFEFLEERNMCTANNNYNAATVDNLSKDTVDTTLTGSSHFKQCQSKMAMENWYFDVARLLCSKSSTDLLVKCLLCNSKFTSFLARKVLIRGMNTNLIEVSQVLIMLKQECLADVQFCVPLLEILRDMMSRKKFKSRNINSAAFSLFTEMKLNGLIEARFSENKKSFSDTSGFLEYLSLLCKVIKYVIYTYEKLETEDIYLIVAVVEKICFPFGDYFFTIPKADKGHLICLQYIKAINILLDIRFFENKSAFQGKIFQISERLRTRIHKYLEMAENSGLVATINFIGAKLSLEAKDNVGSISSLKRQIILLVLKTTAFALKAEGNISMHIEHDLESFWNEISSSVSKSKRHHINDWLPVVFADQDDQWITALISLLIIHKKLNKRQSKNQELMRMSEKTIDNHELSSQTLQQTICPHRLFLQLVRFIDYDHLVLTDFLTSPETPFLFYITQYMHVLIEDWQGFLSVFVNDVQVDSKKHNDVQEWEKSTSDTCSESGRSSYESTKHKVSLPGLSTPGASQLGDLSVRISQALPESNSLLPCQFFGKVITASVDPLQNIKSVSFSHEHSSEPQSYPLQSSLTQGSYNSQLLVESYLTLPSSTVASCGPFIDTSSGSMLCLLTPTSSPCSSSAPPSYVLKEHSVNQHYSKQEYSVSQSHRDDATVGICGRITSSSSQSLVAYSDSDSETTMTETGVNSMVEKESLEEHLCDTEDDSCEAGSRIEAKESCLSDQDSDSDEGILSEHGSATDSIIDPCIKCNGELDVVMGMMIRLRLHIERLDHSNLFPYNVKSLLRLLESCEELYEKPSG